MQDFFIIAQQQAGWATAKITQQGQDELSLDKLWLKLQDVPSSGCVQRFI